MTWLAFFSGLGLLSATLFLVVRSALGTRLVARLSEVPPLAAAECPSVAIVVAARDEERGLERGLRSLLGQDLEGLRVVAVDDRSSDRTGEILARLAREDLRLEALRVDELPAGWLGKNHALALGAERATEELVLFTDADVELEPSTLRRACALVRQRRLDHLTVGPQVDSPGPAIALFVGAFTTLFGLWLVPWRAANPDRDEAMGIGAFNLVRRSAYEAVGGFAAIRNRPDDDLQLGRRLKGAGFRQELATGRGLIRVEWYRSLAEAARGLEKNAFAGLEYSLARAFAAAAALFVVHVVPFVAAPLLALAPPHPLGLWTAALFATAALLQVAAALAARRETAVPAWTALALPVGTLLLAAVVVRSVALTLWRGGILWRGTFYSLEDLRRPPGPDG